MIDIKQVEPSPATEVMVNIYSQFGEDGLIAEVFRRIGTTNKQCFEVGAADGKWFSNSRRWIDEGWSAALIEADESNWPELDKLDNPPRVNVVHGKVEAVGHNSLDSILKQCQFDEHPDLGVIDVDGQEYYLWNGMLAFKPRVMVVEYDIEAAHGFVPDLNGTGQASFAAICSVAVSKGYFNVATTQTNAIFVLNSEREKFFNQSPAPALVEKPAPEIKRVIQGEVLNGFSADDELESKVRELFNKAKPQPILATGKEEEIKIVAILSRPRFGLNVFWDCASEALAPWHIPIQSFYGVFWGQCMQTAMEDNAALDWILTLDYDTVFTSAHVQKLIDCLGQHPEIDAVAGLQVRRGRPLPLAVRSDGQMVMNGGPVQVTTAHFGLTLFRTESLKKLRKPWFWSKPTPDGTWGEGRLDDDIYFWGQWRDAGNTLYVHTGCRIGHVEEMVAEFDDVGKVQHAYLSEWRKRHGHTIKSFE